MNKLDFITFKKHLLFKCTVNKVKRQSIDKKKIFVKHTTEKELYLEYMC